MTLAGSLDALVERYLNAFPRLTTQFDPAWRSQAERGEAFGEAGSGEQRIQWQPTLREPCNDFAGLERALETPIHPDIVDYYGRYWGQNLECTSREGHVSLILLWNQEDIDRLIENLIGHSLSQKRSRSPFSIFFANTEPDSDYFLSVQNTSGRVVLERPGRKPVREVAPTLAAFLARLDPADSPDPQLY